MAAKQKMVSVSIYIDDSLSQERTHFSGKPRILQFRLSGCPSVLGTLLCPIGYSSQRQQPTKAVRTVFQAPSLESD